MIITRMFTTKAFLTFGKMVVQALKNWWEELGPFYQKQYVNLGLWIVLPLVLAVILAFFLGLFK